MKIIFVAGGNSFSGISPIVNNQGKSLQKAGLSIRFFAIAGKGLKGYFKSIYYLRKILYSDNFEIIHAHYGLSGVVALLARRREKLVVSFMGDDLLGSNREDGSVKPASKLVIALNKLLSRFFYDFCIVKSDEMFNMLDIKHKAIVPNGVDLQKFFYISKNEAAKSIGVGKINKLALFVSDPSRPEKNFNLAREAVNLIKEYEVQILTVSGVENSELVFCYNAADVLLMTSFHEGSPNVIKEAMACNCPIVSTRIGDVDWVLGETEGCFLASFNPVDFARKVEQALKYSEVKGRTNGRERITKLGIDSDTVAKRIIEVYEKVLDGKRGLGTRD